MSLQWHCPGYCFCHFCFSNIFWDCRKSALWLLNLNILLKVTDQYWRIPLFLFFGYQKLELKKLKRKKTNTNRHSLTSLDSVLWLLINTGGRCLHPHIVTSLAFMIHMMTRISWNTLDKQGNAVPRNSENSSLPNLLLWIEIGCGNWFMTSIQTSSSLGKLIKSTKGSSLLVVEFLKAHQKGASK